MHIVEYVIPLGENVRKRHYHEAERGRIKSFVVQLEAFIEQGWKPVIRYDCVHGFPHIDYYDKRGEKKKEKLNMTLEDALVLADEDIKENRTKYIERFMKGAKL